MSSTSRGNRVLPTRPRTSSTGPRRFSSTSMRWQPKSISGPPPARSFRKNHERAEPSGMSCHSKARIDREARPADLPRGEDLPDPAEHRVEAAVVRHPQPHAVGATGVDHRATLRSGEGHRLLAEHVPARFGRGDGLRRVQVDGRGHVDRVDLGVPDQLVPVRVPAPGAELAGEAFGQLRPGPADGRQRRSLPRPAARGPPACARCPRSRSTPTAARCLMCPCAQVYHRRQRHTSRWGSPREPIPRAFVRQLPAG